MFSKQELIDLWKATLQQFQKDFPEYDLLLRKNGWRAGVRERLNTAFGWADPKEKLVIINWHLHKHSPKENIVDTMLHEIAHAIDFCKRGRSDHSAHWKKIAAEIGAIAKTKTKRSIKTEYKYVCVFRDGDKGQKLKFLKGYNRRPSGYKVGHVMPDLYLKSDKTGSMGKIWLYSWQEWVKLCNQYGYSPFREDHK